MLQRNIHLLHEHIDMVCRAYLELVVLQRESGERTKQERESVEVKLTLLHMHFETACNTILFAIEDPEVCLFQFEFKKVRRNFDSLSEHFLSIQPNLPFCHLMNKIRMRTIDNYNKV